ncbi:MAG: PrgI family protein [Lactococcus lactis]|nr:PrgI family protein [Lactococcus lactis]
MANNIIVPVPTELKKIKTELIFGLTKRQVIGFGITVAITIPSFLVLKLFGLNVATYGSFVISIPLLFMTMFKKDKIHSEKWIKNIIEYKVLFKEKRLYQVTPKNKEVAIARGFIKDDEKKKSVSKT